MTKIGSWCWDNTSALICIDKLDGSGEQQVEELRPGMSYCVFNYREKIEYYCNGFRGKYLLENLQELKQYENMD